MKLNFKKIASVAASAIMLTSTMGFAAAATYPAPFSLSGGVVVYGAKAATSDVAEAFKIENSISGGSSGGSSSTATCTGECAALFTGSTKVNVNDSLAQVRSILTATELPTVLKKGTFSGNVEAGYTQTIDVGVSPKLIFAKQPTTSDDPSYGFSLPTGAPYIYNASVNFNKAVNFTNSDSKNRELTIFGQKYTIGSSTDSTYLVLFKSATKMSFDSTGTTSGEATISGKKYTIELISASTTTATIQVTNEEGVTDSASIAIGVSKRVGGISVAVLTADSNNQKFIASVIAGADKITLQNSQPVTVGDEATQIDGTYVTFTGGPNNLTKITISVAAKDSDVDALKPGQAFVDPVFKTFKVDFNGALNIADTNSSLREEITVKGGGDDKLDVKFTNNRGNELNFPYVKTIATAGYAELSSGDDSKNITVMEGQNIYKSEFVVVGNEDQGYLLKLTTITNSSSDYAGDKVEFTDVFDTNTKFLATLSNEGVGTVNIQGKIYDLTYNVNAASSDASFVTLNYPDSPGLLTASRIVYPTMQTSKGAKIAFYEPLAVSLSSTSGLKIPNGNGYTDVVWTHVGDSNYTVIVGSGSVQNLNTSSGVVPLNFTIGSFLYQLVPAGANATTLYLRASDGVKVIDPALIIIEGKDDHSVYNGAVVTTKAGTSSTNATGVDLVKRTWSSNAQFSSLSLASNSNIAKSADLYGLIATKYTTDSNHPYAVISYPSEQVYANVYMTDANAVVTPGGGSAPTGPGTLTIVDDSDLSSVADKNLIVVGGSCINKAAAKIIANSEDPICGADFTLKTGVGASQYIIKTVASPYNADKIAILVAGYEAVDTMSAVAKLLDRTVLTDVGTSQVYPITGA